MGAWIETGSPDRSCAYTTSHPSWVRGLKPSQVKQRRRLLPSHPSLVRGLKHHAWR